MNNVYRLKRLPILLGGAALSTACWIIWCGSTSAPKAHGADTPPATTSQEIAGLRAEVERLKGIVPDQSHAMKDVAYHFANLWFAGQKKNWSLADFY